MKAISLFAGIGGICMGFKQAGFDIIWANEIDEAACKTYRYNFGNGYLHEGDIRRVSVSDIPDCDVLTAGFPCQPFSIAGKQRGFKDDRGNLFFEIARIIDKKRPRAIFLENVPNLIEHDNGKTFLVIYTVLAQYGYTVCYRTMYANEYGNLPQVRNRVYISAFKNLEDCDKFKYPDPIRLTRSVRDIININERKNEVYYYKNDHPLVKDFNNTIEYKGLIYNMYGGKIKRTGHGMCPTLIANMGIGNNRIPVVADNWGYRRLTLRECLDFQGFPQNFYFPKTISMNDAYKQIGNSVCVPVVHRIAEKIKEALTDKYKEMKNND